MTEIVDAKRISQELRAEVRERILKLQGPAPGLTTVLVGEDPPSRIYVGKKRAAAAEVGIAGTVLELPAHTSESELLSRLEQLNADASVHGILVQLPLPDQISAARIAEAVDPLKDVDGLHPKNVGHLVANQPGLVPCTPQGCIEILDRYEFGIEGKRAVVLGRSEIVGKPVALLLLHRNATVTWCHSRTRDIADVVREADIVIAAVGQPRMVQGDWIKPGAAVIDVGVNRIAPKKLVGDVDFDQALGRAGLLTRVPGGVGLLTVSLLMRNTLAAYDLQN